MKCETCKMRCLCDELEHKKKIPKSENCRCYIPIKPITNYERLMHKTPEELAEWIAERVLNLTGGSLTMSKQAWLDWLKQEATDD